MIKFTPGIYDIDIDTYHKSNGLSRSGLMLLKKSALHYANTYINSEPHEIELSDSLLLGNAVHCYILEQNEFYNRYYVYDKVDARTKAGKERMEEIYRESVGKKLITTDTFKEILNMYDSFMSNNLASQFLKEAKIEKSIYWNDCRTDTLLKCRPDIWLPHIIGDIKTTNDASPRAFQRDVAAYGYHIQAAMIHDGIYHITDNKIKEYVGLAIEKTSPYAIGVYMLDEKSLNRGHDEYQQLIDDYCDHQLKNEWPGYKPAIISLPSYY